MRVGIISDTPDLPQALVGGLKSCLSEMGHSMERIDRFRPDAPALQTIQSLLNISDLIIATILKPNPNIFYEIGLAHGQQKPVIILVRRDAHLPSDLRGQHYIEFTDTSDGIAQAIFSVRSALSEVERRPRLFTGLKGPFDSFSDAHFGSAFAPTLRFRDLYGLSWYKRHTLFEKWMRELLLSIPSIDVIAPDGPSPDQGYDLLIWNKSDDPDLRLLGNPIPIELKSVSSLNSQILNHLLQLAKRTNIKGMILATTGTNTPSARRRLARLRAEHDVFVICLDRDALIDIVSPGDLMRAIKTAIREAMYREV